MHLFYIFYTFTVEKLATEKNLCFLTYFKVYYFKTYNKNMFATYKKEIYIFIKKLK